MTLTDINVKYLKPAEGRPAFDNGQVDAWIIWDPYFALAEQPGVKVLADATGLASNREYVLAAPDAVQGQDRPTSGRSCHVPEGHRLGHRQPGRARQGPRPRAEDPAGRHHPGAGPQRPAARPGHPGRSAPSCRPSRTASSRWS